MKNQGFKSWIYLLLFFTVIVLPDWLEVFLTHQTFRQAVGDMIRSYIILMIPFLLFNKYYKIYLFILLILAIIFNPFDIGFLYLYHNRIDQVAFEVAMQTNIQEALEFTDGYRIYLIIGFILNILVLFYLYKKISFKDMKKVYIASMLSLILLMIMTYRSSTIVNNTKRVTSEVFIKTLFRNMITTNSPWLFFKYIYVYLEKQNELKKYKILKSKFKFNAKKEDNITQIHILVVGESSRYDHWQINGYKRETDPLLINEKSLISLSNVITGAGATNWSVPMIISPADASKFDDTLKQSSLVGAFKEAGYKTYWLSNQDWFPYLNIHIDEADYQFFLKRKDRFAYDVGLLPYFDEVLNNCQDKNCLIVLHIMGNHWRYDKRYPPKFDIFKPSIDRKSFIRMDDYKKKREIINSYDNSIVYNDYFLSEVIKRLKNINKPTTLTFIADHGENLYDTKRHLFGHGRMINRYVCHVPYFFWFSEKYKKIYPTKIENIYKNKDKKISSATNLFYSMIDLGEINFKNNNKSKSIFSKNFTESDRIVLQGLTPINYDKTQGKIK